METGSKSQLWSDQDPRAALNFLLDKVGKQFAVVSAPLRGFLTLSYGYQIRPIRKWHVSNRRLSCFVIASSGICPESDEASLQVIILWEVSEADMRG